MREKLITILMVPVLVFPIVVIAAGGDLGLIWQEFKAFSQVPLVVTVYAQMASPTATIGPSPTITVGPSPTLTFGPSPTLTVGPGGPSPTVTPFPGVGTAPAPLLTRWGYISASIVLALVALWSLSRGTSGSRSTRDG
jgi:hypothetical protein